MTVSEYIKGQFEDFGMRLSDASVLEFVLKNGLTANAEVSASNFREVQVATVKFVPKLLAMPQSVQEGGLSISKAAHDSLRDWYRMQCKELGIKDELTKRPKVTFL